MVERGLGNRRLFANWLEEVGCVVVSFDSMDEAFRVLDKESFDLVILDWQIPDSSAVSFVGRLRAEATIGSPILFMALHSDGEGRVAMFQAGADACLTKPVGRDEFIARVEALHRCSLGKYGHEEIMDFSPYSFELRTRNVTVEGDVVRLTDREFELALFLFLHKGQILSRGHILDAIWGREDKWNTRTLDTHMSRIRRKLRIEPNNGWRISAIYQRGYRLHRTQEENPAALSWREASCLLDE